MARPIMVAIGTIPVVMAAMIAVPMLTQPDIPFSASNPDDRLEVEYTKHQLKRLSYGVTERTGAQQTEILLIRDDGTIQYSMTRDGVPGQEFHGTADADRLARLAAMIKETGFIAIPAETFPINDNATEYQKSSLRITLNGVTNQIHWPEQNATSGFVPPIVTMVESELGAIIDGIDDRYK